MDELVNLLIIFISTIISVSVLGVVAGFSPTLYITQVAITSKSKKYRSYTASLMGGILFAILVLIIIFQTINLETLVGLIDTTVHALRVSVIFNIIAGGAFIYGGIWYLRHQEIQQPSSSKLKSATGAVGLFSLGFVRTFVSISGVTATFIAGNIIANVSIGIIERLIYTAIFFVAAVVPFVIIIRMMQKNPDRLTSLTNRLMIWLRSMNYRLIVGVSATLLGGSIIFFNVMMALFY